MKYWSKPIPPDDPIWICGDREPVPLSRIKNDHLQNIERFLVGRGARSRSPWREQLFTDWYDIIRDELDKRSLLLLLEDHPKAILHNPFEDRNRNE